MRHVVVVHEVALHALDLAVVVADPLVPLGQPSPYLDLTLDKNGGNNGDTIGLTITVKSVDATYGGHPFVVAARNVSGAHATFGWVSSL